MSHVVGIDPGRKGAFCLIEIERGVPVELVMMPPTEQDVADLIRTWHSVFEIERWYMERVQGRPKDSAPSAFTFGMGYGVIKGCLAILEVSRELIPPVTWMKTFNYTTGGDKKKSREKCQEIFPVLPGSLRHTNDNVEAVLIAEAGRRRLMQDRGQEASPPEPIDDPWTPKRKRKRG